MTTKTIKRGKLTFRGEWLGEENFSVVVSGPAGVLDALDVGNLTWPKDTEISKLAGCTVRWFDGGDNLLEALYRKEVES